MEGPIVPDVDIVRRVMRAESRYTLSRLSVLHRLPGNPVGVETEEMGDALALSARYIPNPGMNRVVGLGDDRADQVGRLDAWFRNRGVAGVFETIPGLSGEPLARALASAGYVQTRWHATLCAAPFPPDRAPPAGVTVEHVGAATLDTFLETHCRGWAIPDPAGFKTNVAGWIEEPGWRLYLGRLNGEPAGTAILFTLDGVGYCADSACDPAFRGHGVHAALLHRRMVDAGGLGCDLVCAMADYLSTSHRNMVRAGFALLHTKSIWTRLT
jgi:hypothetical protein